LIYFVSLILTGHLSSYGSFLIYFFYVWLILYLSFYHQHPLRVRIFTTDLKRS